MSDTYLTLIRLAFYVLALVIPAYLLTREHTKRSISKAINAGTSGLKSRYNDLSLWDKRLFWILITAITCTVVLVFPSYVKMLEDKDSPRAAIMPPIRTHR